MTVFFFDSDADEWNTCGIHSRHSHNRSTRRYTRLQRSCPSLYNKPVSMSVTRVGHLSCDMLFIVWLCIDCSIGIYAPHPVPRAASDYRGRVFVCVICRHAGRWVYSWAQVFASRLLTSLDFGFGGRCDVCCA